MTVEDQLQQKFPNHSPPGMQSECETLRRDLSIGDEVAGTVRFKSEFGPGLISDGDFRRCFLSRRLKV